MERKGEEEGKRGEETLHWHLNIYIAKKSQQSIPPLPTPPSPPPLPPPLLLPSSLPPSPLLLSSSSSPPPFILLLLSSPPPLFLLLLHLPLFCSSSPADLAGCVHSLVLLAPTLVCSPLIEIGQTLSVACNVYYTYIKLCMYVPYILE